MKIKFYLTEDVIHMMDDKPVVEKKHFKTVIVSSDDGVIDINGDSRRVVESEDGEIVDMYYKGNFIVITTNNSIRYRLRLSENFIGVSKYMLEEEKEKELYFERNFTKIGAKIGS